MTLRSALVVGRGVIGTRHLRVLAALGLRVGMVSRRPRAGDFDSLQAGLAALDPGYVVVATETADHGRVLDALAGLGFAGRVLVEKPLFAFPRPLPVHRFARLGIGYDLRFDPGLRALRRRLQGERVLSAQLYAGQYLPDWRPDEDYRRFYSCRAAAGGGMLRDLSHELDYAGWLFGDWRRLAALGGHWSELEMDADDVFVLLAAFEGCPAATIQLNGLDRTGRRTLLVNTAAHTFALDFGAGTLTCDREPVAVFAREPDQPWHDLHRAMLENPPGSDDGVCGPDEALRVMAMIAAAEQAGQAGCWVAA
jgi:predicted dehydrogenase